MIIDVNKSSLLMLGPLMMLSDPMTRAVFVVLPHPPSGRQTRGAHRLEAQRPCATPPLAWLKLGPPDGPGQPT